MNCVELCFKVPLLGDSALLTKCLVSFLLTEYSQVKIEYLDGRDITNGKKLAQLEFGPENAMTSLTLLYRPGHYDILYPKEG